MYKVLSVFADLQDSNHIYNVGDVYPRAGYTPSDIRVEELSTDKNKLHMPLIQKLADGGSVEVGKPHIIGEPEPVVQVVVQESGTALEEPVQATEKTTTRGRKKKNVDNAD